MTVLAALVSRGRVWIGADSGVEVDSTIWRQLAPKVFHVPTGNKNLRCVVGCAGFDTCEDAWRGARPRPLRDTADPDEWVRGELFEAVRRAGLQEAPEKHVDESCALIGLGSRLYYCGGIAKPWRMADKYAVTGSASDPAQGALRVLSKHLKALGLSPRDAVLEALEASLAHSENAREPFTVLST